MIMGREYQRRQYTKENNEVSGGPNTGITVLHTLLEREEGTDE